MFVFVSLISYYNQRADLSETFNNSSLMDDTCFGQKCSNQFQFSKNRIICFSNLDKGL